VEISITTVMRSTELSVTRDVTNTFIDNVEAHEATPLWSGTA
jgi:hypothetical protein